MTHEKKVAQPGDMCGGTTLCNGYLYWDPIAKELFCSGCSYIQKRCCCPIVTIILRR